MKKSILLLLALIPTSIWGFRLPLDRDGVSAESIDDVGVRVFTTTHSIAASGVSGSSIALFGVLTATLPAGVAVNGAWIEIRSSDTFNRSSELILPPIMVTSTTRNTFVVFNPPVVVPTRMSVNVRTLATDIVTNTVITSFFYRFLATSTNENVWIPLDTFQGKKVHTSDLYGVSAATDNRPGNAADNGIGADNFDFTSDERLFTSTDVSKGFLYGWVASTGTSGSYIVFKDTTGAGTTVTSSFLLPPIFYNTLNYSTEENPESQTKPFTFPWPIIFERGLSAQRSVSTDRFRVFIRDANALR